MLLPVIAFVAMHLFAAVLADIPVEKDPFGWASWDGFKMMCRDLDLKPAENVDFLRDNAATIAESPRQDLQIRLPVGYCTQLACDDSSAILYCKHVSTAPQSLPNCPMTDDSRLVHLGPW